jgi:hypothetical protein
LSNASILVGYGDAAGLGQRENNHQRLSLVFSSPPLTFWRSLPVTTSCLPLLSQVHDLRLRERFENKPSLPPSFRFLSTILPTPLKKIQKTKYYYFLLNFTGTESVDKSRGCLGSKHINFMTKAESKPVSVSESKSERESNRKTREENLAHLSGHSSFPGFPDQSGSRLKKNVTRT